MTYLAKPLKESSFKATPKTLNLCLTACVGCHPLGQRLELPGSQLYGKIIILHCFTSQPQTLKLSV